MSTVQLNTFEVLFSLPYAPRGLHCLQPQLLFPLLSSLFRYLLGSPLHIELITSSLPTPALSRPRHVWPPLQLFFLFFYFFIPFRFADQMFNSNYASSINSTWKQRVAVSRRFTIQERP